MGASENQSVRAGQEMLLAPYLAAIITQLSERGVPAESLLSGTDLHPADLDQDELRVPEGACLLILGRARALGWSRDMALQLGGTLDLGSHGFLGYAVLASRTLGEALELSARYFRTRTGLITLTMFEEGDQAVLQFEEGVPLQGLFPWLMDVLLASMLRSCQQLFGAPPPAATEIRLGYPAEPAHADLLQGFEGRFETDCGFTQVRIPASWLRQTLPGADPNLVRLASVQCERALRDMQETDGLLGRVRRLARECLDEPRSLDRVAGQLHMTPRTLRRRLQAMGTSYQQQVEQMRHAMAVDLLARTRQPVEQIATELGYADPSNFGRAFRRWTGQSPRQFRASRRDTLTSA